MKTSFTSRFKIFLHIFLGLMLGSAIAMIYLSSTDLFRDYVQTKIQEQFRATFGLKFRCKIESIEWLPCRIQLSGIHISPETEPGYTQTSQLVNPASGEQWSVIAEKVTVKGSWLSLLVQGAMKVHMQFDHVIMMELFEQAPEKLSHFCAQMFNQIGSSWLIYEGISVSDGLLYLKKTTDGLYVQIPYVSQMQSDASMTKIQVYVQDGVAWYHDGMSVEKISGSLVCELPFVQFFERMRGDIQMNYDLNKSGIKIPGFLAGSMHHGDGELTIKTEDGSVVIDPIYVQCRAQECWCDMNIKASPDILKYFDMPESLSQLEGHVGIHVKLDVYNILSTLQVSVLLQDLLYKTKPILPGGKFTIKEHSHDGCTGLFHMNGKDWMSVDFKALADHQKICAQNIMMIEILQAQGWIVRPGDVLLSAVRGSDGSVCGTYTVAVEHSITGEKYLLRGSLDYQDGALLLSGKLNDFEYRGELRVMPELAFKNFQIFNKQQLVVDFSTDEHDPSYVVGSVDFSMVKAVVPEPFKMSFAQEGSFVGRGYFKDSIWHATVQAHYAHIRIPYVYNVIQNLSATCEIDTLKHNIVLKDLLIDWYEGTMRCQRATFWFDKYLNCYGLHVPIMFDKIMMSWNKGVYGLLSGRILLSKYQLHDPMHLEGKLLVHNAEVKENILSPEFHEMMLNMAHDPSLSQTSQNLTLDVGLLVHDAVTVKTSFMVAKAMVELVVKGTLQKPHVAGQVEILDGTLQFPYKPIQIIGGRILLLPDQPLDPVIELTARGKLKRYSVSLRVWGTALDPHIQFDAQPYLSEEQILSLLMLGVEDQSLGLMVPAFLTQKLQEIMFGPALSKTKLKAVFDLILRSLKYVRFLPQFATQADRGGMRGIFEIDASEHLHGKIDTNFTHIEDTKFDVDYGVTDDVTLRLQKDGPTTYGGEVEFRWKFS